MIKTMSNEFVIDLDDQNKFIYVKNMFWVKPKSIDFWKIEEQSRFVNSGRNGILNSFSGSSVFKRTLSSFGLLSSFVETKSNFVLRRPNSF